MNSEFEQKIWFEQFYPQSIWTKISPNNLNKHVNIEFEQIYQHSIWTEISGTIFEKKMNNQLKQKIEQVYD